jgi:glutathione peroxidase
MLKVLALAAFAGALASTTTSSIAAEAAAANASKTASATPTALDFKMNSLDGKEVDLGQYQGKVVMIVNVASHCGNTPQYTQLEALHEKFGKEGLEILGFPCNQFGAQEPGTAEEIQKFCTNKYSVSFPLFAKVDVNGDKACPLYKHLTALDTKPKGKGKVSWNFEKFIVGRNGEVVARFEPGTKPDAKEVMAVVEAELAKK